jgi:adenylate cyclase
MSSTGSGNGGASRAVYDALGRLRAIPELVNDPEALAALDELARRVDPVAIEKAERLNRAVQLVSSSLDLESVLHKALDVAVRVMHAERGFIILRHGRGVAALHNMEEPASEAPSRSIVDRVMKSGDAIFTTDAQTDPEWSSKDSILAQHLRSIACVPLKVRTSVIGALYLDSRVIPGLFSSGDREILIAFAKEAAMSIENARLFQEERERRKRVADLQAFQTRILEAIASGVITLSPERIITTFNRAAEATFDMPSKRMVGKTPAAITRLIPEFPEMFEIFMTSGAVQLRAEVEAYRSDGTLLTLEMQLSPLESDEGLGVAMVVTDVTKQRILEDKVAQGQAKSHQIQESFSRYLAPHVVQSLMHDPSSIRLGGERKRATTLFADVRGFTAMAAQMTPERVVEILNTYFEEAVRIVFEHDGLLDKFYGDGLMAVFGPPLVRPDDAARAVAAAIDLHEVVASLGPRLDYPLQISAGLSTGDVVAGHFGSSRRMDYTVIGDAVNLANGLQAAAPPGAIYCDEETITAAGAISRPLHRLSVRVKGRDELVTAYAIFPKLVKSSSFRR